MSNRDIASDLVRSMEATRAAEFDVLLRSWASGGVDKNDTIQGLAKIAENGPIDERIRAVKLIGALKLTQLESLMTGILDSEFPNDVVAQMLAAKTKTLPTYMLLASLCATLMIFNSKNGIEKSEQIAKRFRDTWIAEYLGAIKAALP